MVVVGGRWEWEGVIVVVVVVVVVENGVGFRRGGRGNGERGSVVVVGGCWGAGVLK